MKRNILFAAAAVFALPGAFSVAAPADEETLKKIEQDWGDAYVKRNPAFVQQVTTDDFVFIGPDGNLQDKADYVKSMTGDTVFTEFKIDNLKARIYGDSAVITGIATIKAKTGTKDESGKYSFTDVFVKQKGEWKAVSGHATPIAVKP